MTRLFLMMIGLLALFAPELALAQTHLDHAGGNTWTVYVAGNVTAVAAVLNAIAQMVNSGDYVDIITFLGVVGVLVQSVIAGFDMRKMPQVMIYVLVVFIVTQSIFNWKVRIALEDPLDGGTVDVVENVPAAVGLPAAIASSLSRDLTILLETYFTTPNGVGKLSEGGTFNLMAQLQRDATKVVIRDIHTAASFKHYINDCVTKALYLGRMSAQEVYSSPNMLDTLGQANFNSILTQVFSDTRPAGWVVSCREAYDSTGDIPDVGVPGLRERINGQLDQMVADFTFTQAGRYKDEVLAGENWTDTAAFNFLSDAVSSSAVWLTDGNSTLAAEDVVRQNAILNTYIEGATESLASGSEDLAFQLSATEAAESQVGSWQVAAEVLSQLLGYLYTILQVYAFGIAPVVLIALFVPNFGKTVFTTYMQVLIWLALWEPMLSIVNFIVAAMGQSYLGTHMIVQGTGGFSLENRPIVTKAADNFVTAASFFGTLVPTITWTLVRSGSVGFTSFIESAINASSASSAAAKIASGNLSGGNKSFNNTSANKFDTAMATSIGTSGVDVGTGIGLTRTTQGGGGVVGANGGNIAQQFRGGGGGSDQRAAALSRGHAESAAAGLNQSQLATAGSRDTAGEMMSAGRQRAFEQSFTDQNSQTMSWMKDRVEEAASVINSDASEQEKQRAFTQLAANYGALAMAAGVGSVDALKGLGSVLQRAGPAGQSLMQGLQKFAGSAAAKGGSLASAVGNFFRGGGQIAAGAARAVAAAGLGGTAAAASAVAAAGGAGYYATSRLLATEAGQNFQNALSDKIWEYFGDDGAAEAQQIIGAAEAALADGRVDSSEAGALAAADGLAARVNTMQAMDQMMTLATGAGFAAGTVALGANNGSGPSAAFNPNDADAGSDDATPMRRRDQNQPSGSNGSTGSNNGSGNGGNGSGNKPRARGGLRGFLGGLAGGLALTGASQYEQGGATGVSVSDQDRGSDALRTNQVATEQETFAVRNAASEMYASQANRSLENIQAYQESVSREYTESISAYESGQVSDTTQNSYDNNVSWSGNLSVSPGAAQDVMTAGQGLADRINPAQALDRDFAAETDAAAAGIDETRSTNDAATGATRLAPGRADEIWGNRDVGPSNPDALREESDGWVQRAGSQVEERPDLLGSNFGGDVETDTALRNNQRVADSVGSFDSTEFGDGVSVGTTSDGQSMTYFSSGALGSKITMPSETVSIGGASGQMSGVIRIGEGEGAQYVPAYEVDTGNVQYQSGTIQDEQGNEQPVYDTVRGTVLATADNGGGNFTTLAVTGSNAGADQLAQEQFVQGVTTGDTNSSGTAGDGTASAFAPRAEAITVSNDALGREGAGSTQLTPTGRANDNGDTYAAPDGVVYGKNDDGEWVSQGSNAQTRGTMDMGDAADNTYDVARDTFVGGVSEAVGAITGSGGPGDTAALGTAPGANASDDQSEVPQVSTLAATNMTSNGDAVYRDGEGDQAEYYAVNNNGETYRLSMSEQSRLADEEWAEGVNAAASDQPTFTGLR